MAKTAETKITQAQSILELKRVFCVVLTAIPVFSMLLCLSKSFTLFLFSIHIIRY